MDPFLLVISPFRWILAWLGLTERGIRPPHFLSDLTLFPPLCLSLPTRAEPAHLGPSPRSTDSPAECGLDEVYRVPQCPVPGFKPLIAEGVRQWVGHTPFEPTYPFTQVGQHEFGKKRSQAFIQTVISSRNPIQKFKIIFFPFIKKKTHASDDAVGE